MEYSHEYLAEFVTKAQNGDSNAFAQLYSLTVNKVLNYCKCYLKDEYLAQDAVQDIYISALKNIKKLNDPTLFVAWLNQISFHTCYDICKSRKTDYGDIDSEMMEEICDSKPDSNPENVVMDTDEKKRLKDAINRLSVSNQQLITLRYFNNMKIDDIVKATGISKSTVKRNLQSAVESLKNMMGGKV